ncbi:KAP family P-loop NTPase fold protein [Kordiimonas sp.]|uniref:KAP family P-loop NTPase fold protein n=1 Tax=Kordiimonas sp. TaxID=1970157 RepID=UPI003B51B7B7
MWADTDVRVDYLNFSEVADVVASMIANPKLLPISVGVYGGWGAGKSTVLGLVEESLKTQSSDKSYIVVNFDAWLFQDFDDARAALLDVLTKKLLERAPTPSLKEKALQLVKRVDFFRAAGLMADWGLAAATGTPPGVLSKVSSSARRILEGDGHEEDANNLRLGVSSLVDAGEKVVRKRPHAAPTERPLSPAEEIEAFRSQFGSFLGELEAPLVIFIDNLDRCLPKKAIQTLEAVRQFLFLPSTAFVIAADEEMIRHAVKEHYKDPGDRLVTDYLDKMVQVSVRVPRIGVQELTVYLMLLFMEDAGVSDERFDAFQTALLERLQSLWKGAGVDRKFAEEALKVAEDEESLSEALGLATRLAPLLAHSSRILGNPRIVKRLLNTIRIRKQIATQRGMPIDEALIAKIAILERCTAGKTFSAFCGLVNAAGSGKPTVLSKLEKNALDDKKFEGLLPTDFKADQEFLKEWVLLPPSLDEIDLRPAVYLSRDTATITASVMGLSVQGEAALRGLAEVASLSSPAAKKLISELPLDELEVVAEELVGLLRKTQDWESRPRPLNGLLLLADEHEPARQLLRGFIVSLQLKEPPKWLVALTNKRSWLAKEEGK